MNDNCVESNIVSSQKDIVEYPSCGLFDLESPNSKEAVRMRPCQRIGRPLMEGDGRHLVETDEVCSGALSNVRVDDLSKSSRGRAILHMSKARLRPNS